MLITKESTGLCESQGLICQIDHGGPHCPLTPGRVSEGLARVHVTLSGGGGIPQTVVPD